MSQMFHWLDVYHSDVINFSTRDGDVVKESEDVVKESSRRRRTATLAESLVEMVNNQKWLVDFTEISSPLNELNLKLRLQIDNVLNPIKTFQMKSKVVNSGRKLN